MSIEKKYPSTTTIIVQYKSGFGTSIGNIFNTNEDQLSDTELGSMYADETVVNEIFMKIPQGKQTQFNLFVDTVFIPQVHKERQIPMENNTLWNIVAGTHEGPEGLFYKIHCDWYVQTEGKKSLGEIFLETTKKYQTGLLEIEQNTSTNSPEEPIQNFKNTYLSNFASSPIQVGDGIFPTVEHAYQYYKIKCYEATGETNDIDINMFFDEKIPAGKTKTAVTALELAENESRDSQKIGIMYMLVYQKFLQNEELRLQLLTTGDAELIEGNDHGDTFRGRDNKTGKGTNYLGKILMKVRKELQQESV